MRLTIRAKLTAAFGLILLLMGTAGYFAIGSLASANDRMQLFASGPFIQAQRALQIESMSTHAARIFARSLVVPTQDERMKMQTEFQANDTDFKAVLQNYANDLPPERRGQTQALADAWARQAEAGNRGLLRAAKNGTNRATELATGEGAKHASVIDRITIALRERPTLSDQARKNAENVELRLMRARRDIYRTIAETQDDVLKTLVEGFDSTMTAVAADIQSLVQGAREAGFDIDATALAAAWKAYEPIARQAVALGAANDDYAATMIYVGPFTQNRLAVQAEVKKLTDAETASARSYVTATQNSYESTRAMLLALVAGAVLLGTAMAAWMAVSISRGLSRAVGLAREVAAGDLTQEITVSGRDEIADLARAMKGMTEKLRDVVGQVSGAAQNVSAGSSQLSASAEQLSEGSTEQAASTEEASASMEQMAANVKQNADNANQTEKIASQSAKDAEASGIAVGRAVDAMQTIAGKITIVQEIARQTDLLALNAAVEAARAGEHGRGFAVVASEVRKLAERSQAAAAEIGTLSSDTLKVAQEAGAMLGRLVPDIKRTAELVEEITSACREQDVGASQINQAIQQLDKVTQQNAAASEEVSATSEELASQAEQLQDSIAFFRTTTTGPAALPAPIGNTVRQLRMSATAAAGNRPKRPASPAMAENHPASRKPERTGFAFDMASNAAGEHHDAEFQRS